jgi:uncharacterized protein YdeI (YjbR/CyaY-like superfamily)
LYYKKGAAKPSVPFDEAVEEALCFGWIDSLVKNIDERRYAQKFTPRKARSKWSASNIERANKMIAAGRMTPAGMAAFAGHESRTAPPRPDRLPAALEKKFKSSTAAWQNFCAFPPGYRRMTIAWVAGAKRPETQLKRLTELIESAERNERLKFI